MVEHTQIQSGARFVWEQRSSAPANILCVISLLWLAVGVTHSQSNLNEETVAHNCIQLKLKKQTENDIANICNVNIFGLWNMQNICWDKTKTYIVHYVFYDPNN